MKNKLYFIPLLLIPILMIVFGSFFDLQINQALYDRTNGFGLTMAAVGEAPGYAAIALLGGVLFFLGLKRYDLWWQKTLFIGAGVAALIVAIYFQSDHVINGNAFNIEHEWWALPFVGIPVALVLCGAGFGFGYYLGLKSDNPNLLKMVIIIAGIILASVLIITIVKSIMHRTRFRYLYDIGDGVLFHEYGNWWQRGTMPIVEEFKEEFKSFPSGHTGTAALGLVMMAFIPLFKKEWTEKKWLQPVLILIGTIWTLLVAFSRMLVGAHFLSDVGFGFFISMVIYLVADLIFYPIKCINKEITEEKPTV